MSEGWERTSLVVQWLAICTPNAGDPVQSLARGTRYHMLHLRAHTLKLKILHATMKIELLSAAAKTCYSQINRCFSFGFFFFFFVFFKDGRTEKDSHH